ncbi:MAG: Rrf2 family transcriptional regulator [Desulfovibrio sp.]|jgi:Rrf2 family protein|nr:Rrf2 family transcriptional regulator [Desulfovibrio sp.]
MGVSIKCQYGLRALFELGRRWGQGLVRIPEIARVQMIPERFLENILNQLRQGGFVESRRGRGGGFMLARPPSGITVEELISFLDGQIYHLNCDGEQPVHPCPLRGGCVFMPLWKEARAALTNVYRSKTLQDLIDLDNLPRLPDYNI